MPGSCAGKQLHVGFIRDLSMMQHLTPGLIYIIESPPGTVLAHTIDTTRVRISGGAGSGGSIFHLRGRNGVLGNLRLNVPGVYG